MATSLFLQGRFIRAEVQRLIDAYPELAEDDDLRTDTLEGETDALEFISRALSQRQEAAAMQDAVKARIADLSERAARYGRKADAMKRLIQSIMQTADVAKLELPEATLSIAKPRRSVEVLDVDELPQGYFKVERKADKTAIKQALEAGERIPGAELVTGEASLTVRTK